MNNVDMINIRIERTRNRLIEDMERAIRNLQYEVNQLKDNENYKPNSLGVIQYNSIDVTCSRLAALHEAKELIEE